MLALNLQEILKSNSMYDILLKLSMNPEDIKAAGDLSKLVEEIRQNK